MNRMMTTLKARWAGLEPSDQRALTIGGAAAAVLIFIGLVIVPMYQSMQRLEKQNPVLRQQLSVMGMQAVEVKRLRATPVSTHSGGSLLSTLEKSVNHNSLKPNVQSLTPRGDQTATLQLSAVQYSKLINWLAQLDAQHLVKLVEAELRKTESPGVIDATLVFSKPK